MSGNPSCHKTKNPGISVFQKSLIHCTQLSISTVVSGQGSRNGSQKHRKEESKNEKADDGYDPDGGLYDSRWRGERGLSAAPRMRSDLPLDSLNLSDPRVVHFSALMAGAVFGPTVDGRFRP